MKPKVLFLCILMMALAGCRSPQDKLIQGKWGNGNVHYWSEWNFEQGVYSYYYDGNNSITQLYETGHYRITGWGEDFIDLELYDRKGGIDMGEETVSLRIDLEGEGVIRIKGGDYYLVSAPSLEALNTARAPTEAVH